MDMYSSLNELDNVEQSLIKNFQDNFYQEFVYKVQSNRRLTDDEVYTVAQGQLYTGKQAQNMRIIDDIGGFYDVVDDLANDLNIEDPDVVFIRSSSSFRLPFGNANVKSQFYEVISSFIPMLGSSYLAEDALQFDFK